MRAVLVVPSMLRLQLLNHFSSGLIGKPFRGRAMVKQKISLFPTEELMLIGILCKVAIVFMLQIFCDLDHAFDLVIRWVFSMGFLIPENVLGRGQGSLFRKAILLGQFLCQQGRLGIARLKFLSRKVSKGIRRAKDFLLCLKPKTSFN